MNMPLAPSDVTLCLVSLRRDLDLQLLRGPVPQLRGRRHLPLLPVRYARHRPPPSHYETVADLRPPYIPWHGAGVFVPNWKKKDESLSKYEDFEAYKARTWLVLPYIY